MPKISINILTKDRAELLKKALLSVLGQSFKDYEVVAVNDGSADETEKILKDYKISKFQNLKIITHSTSLGITASRQEALLVSSGEYIAILDDDDEWIDAEKLSKQVKYLDEHKKCVLIGGGIEIADSEKRTAKKIRPQTDEKIRKTMLFRNNFFTSTVMFRKDIAKMVGGFVKDKIDLAEDYDLWLRMGKIGKMFNFKEPFTLYAKPSYNKEKLNLFLRKQLQLIGRYKNYYPWYFLASLALKIRLRP